ncbi:MAG: tRNA (adenosine(37)-N6)-threonylcarbamoyltransferase complex ATPase subunit type 1 TsaE [Flavisolibacter sp.]
MTYNVSIEELDEFASVFWMKAKDRRIFAFHGEMGSGKTTLIGALCRWKGINDVVGSPTFSIINEYSYTENELERTIYHIDLYRLASIEDVIRAGVEDCIYSNEICMVEWPEKAPGLFDEESVHVHIHSISENERKIELLLPYTYDNSLK